MKDEDCEDRAQKQLASLKRDMRKTMEDATVRAVHKVMAEFEAKSDERLMENAQGDLERIKLVQTGVGIGKPEQNYLAGVPPMLPQMRDGETIVVTEYAQQEPVQETAWQALPAGPIKVLHQCRAALIGPVADGLARRCAVAAIDAELARQAQQQEPVAWMLEWTFNGEERGYRLYDDERHCIFDAESDGGVCRPLYTSPPASKPWVGLTQDELSMIGDRMRTWNSHSLVDVYTAIEAKLREKNA